MGVLQGLDHVGGFSTKMKDRAIFHNRDKCRGVLRQSGADLDAGKLGRPP